MKPGFFVGGHCDELQGFPGDAMLMMMRGFSPDFQVGVLANRSDKAFAPSWLSSATTL
jgi:hypothetical protein